GGRRRRARRHARARRRAVGQLRGGQSRGGGLPRVGGTAALASMSIRVLLADDQALVRVGLRALGNAEPDMGGGGGAANGREAIDGVRRMRPDVIVMDIRMPVLDGLEATRSIAGDPQLDGVRVLVLTTFEIDEYVFDALRAGAGGFLLKDAEPTEFLR